MLQKLFQTVRNLKIHQKLILSYLIVVLLPISITVYFLIVRITKETFNQTLTSNKINYEQLQNNVANLFDSYIMLSNSITEAAFIQYVNSTFPDDMDIANKYYNYYEARSIYNNKYAIYSLEGIKISIYSNNSSILYDNNLIRFIDEDIIKEDWYKEAAAGSTPYVVTSPFTDSSGDLAFSIVKLIENNQLTHRINLLRLEVPLTALRNLIEKEGANKDIYLISPNDTVMLSTKKELIGKTIKEADLENIKNMKSSLINKLEYSTKQQGVVFNELLGNKYPLDDYRLITVISPSVILGKTNEIVRYSLLVCLGSITIAVFFIIIFSNTLTKKIKTLVNTMSKVRGGNLDISIMSEDKDEIGELSRSFDSMIKRINTLINKVYVQDLEVKELEIRRKEAELQAFQSQINPHFLFNTVESIRMNVLKNGDLETSNIIQSFSRLLRKSIEWKSHFVSLASEMDLVDSYLKIQKFRYRDRFDYKINISTELSKVIIPKFIIQPIVENAIYHGLEMKKKDGLLRIYAYKSSDNLKIIVSDNGMGIEEARLKELNDLIDNKETAANSSSIGLKNINQRIKILYGSDFGLTFSSKLRKGTKVEILLPIENKRGEPSV
jgi:two-component system sensor histidine kinase YesM